MKKMKFLLLPVLFAATLFLGSCNEEIDTIGDYTETPILFCLLNQADSIHYVKLTKTFQGTNNAIDVAQIPDSSYYQQADIVIDEVIAGNVVRSWNLSDTTLNTKVPGAFFNPSQKLYYFKTNTSSPLNTSATYKLKATLNGGEYSVTAETQLVTGISVVSPISSYRFVETIGGVKQFSTALCKANIGNAAVMNATLEITFDERFGASTVDKTFSWNVGELTGSQLSGTDVSFQLSGSNFYSLMKQNSTADATIDRRRLKRFRMVITGGSEELSRYIIVNKPSTTLAQNKPSFTNLKTSDGRDAVGLFSSRYTVIQEKLEFVVTGVLSSRCIDQTSLRVLCDGGITGTGGILFCSNNTLDSGFGNYCP
jgi:hypothetical protein